MKTRFVRGLLSASLFICLFFVASSCKKEDPVPAAATPTAADLAGNYTGRYAITLSGTVLPTALTSSGTGTFAVTASGANAQVVATLNTVDMFPTDAATVKGILNKDTLTLTYGLKTFGGTKTAINKYVHASTRIPLASRLAPTAVMIPALTAPTLGTTINNLNSTVGGTLTLNKAGAAALLPSLATAINALPDADIVLTLSVVISNATKQAAASRTSNDGNDGNGGHSCGG